MEELSFIKPTNTLRIGICRICYDRSSGIHYNCESCEGKSSEILIFLKLIDLI